MTRLIRFTTGAGRPRARRTGRVEEREAHWLTCGLLDGARALEVVEVPRGEARHAALTLMRLDSGSKAKASVIALRTDPRS